MNYQNLLTATRESLNVDLKVKEGKIPDDLSGFVFINSGAGTVNSGGLPYKKKLPNGDMNKEYGSPVINGDGYIFRFDMTQKGKINLKTNILKPPCYYADLASSPLLNGKNNPYAKIAFKNKGLARMSMKLGTRNQLNTAITAFRTPGDDQLRMLATFDAGRPFEFDAEKINVITPIGRNKFWRSGTPPFFYDPFPMFLTTAHPAYDPETREVFSVNFTKTTKRLLSATEIFELLAKDKKGFEKKLEERIKQWKNYESKEKAIEEVNEFFYHAQEAKKKKSLKKMLKAIYKKSVGHKLSNEDAVYVVIWQGEDTPQSIKILNEDGSDIQIQHNIHQIGFSKDYLILADTNFKFTLNVMMNNPFANNKKLNSFLRELLSGVQNDYSSIYIVPRNELTKGKKEVRAHKVILPVETVHFSVDYNNDNDIVTLHLAHNCSACPAEWLRHYDTRKIDGQRVDEQKVGMIAVGAMDISKIGKVRIDVKNRAVLQKESKFLHIEGNLDEKDPGPHTWGIGLHTYNGILSPDSNVDKISHVFWQAYGLSDEILTEFVYRLYQSPERNRIYSAEEMLEFTKKGAPFVLQTVATEGMEVTDYYSFPENVYMWSLQFVPSSQPKDNVPEALNGYILCTVVGKTENTTKGDSYYSEIWLFDAQDLKKGPVTKLYHEKMQFAFTIHSIWVDSASSVTTPPYTINIQEDYDEQISQVKRKKLRKKVQKLMNEGVYPYFKQSN
ncbi:carotenoid oxygenase family protein [Aquimarina brevivitae]|uniref:Retinal pigment epithelial membrane protein n=1 Tax=Aquimarina brevivitae TaxID=323412 RepID=A0A4Q7P0Z5_9FLAO|nr:carotenoid oxygenase family protein [Aquimarina brevivitae]RZS93481.1 retinal pigment epithelial membrane protein [Aquimarina brevivitae]